jgi:hypothetical protein
MNITWRKSSYSGGEGNCVEAADLRNSVLVRDTQDRTGPILRFSPAVWRVFADRVKRSLVTHLQPRSADICRALTSEGKHSGFRACTGVGRVGKAEPFTCVLL